MTTTFDAYTFARAWLSVSLAASSDKDRPALHKTVSIELYPEGVRLVSTDSYLLLTSWAPCEGHEDDPEPPVDEPPVRRAVAMDPHGRARGFLAHLMKLAGAAAREIGEGQEPAGLITLRLSIDAVGDATVKPTLDGMAATWVVLDHPNNERLRLQAYEGTVRRAVRLERRARMSQYAANTSVSVESSKAEIERTLQRYGAASFMTGWDRERAVLGFVIVGRQIRFVLELPDRDDPEFTRHSRGSRTPEAAAKAWEQACRQRWRALALVIKAKLEAVESGITTIEDEFLAHTVLPDGSTAGQWMAPQIAHAYAAGTMPTTLLALAAGPKP